MAEAEPGTAAAAARARAPVRAGVLGAAYVALGPIAVLASTWSQIMLLALAVILPASTAPVVDFARAFLGGRAGRAFALFVAWAIASIAFALDPGAAALAAAKVVLFVVAGLVVVACARAADAHGRRTIQNGVLACVATIAVMLVWIAIDHGALASAIKGHAARSINVANPGTAIFSLLACPAAAILVARTRRTWPALVFAAATLGLFAFLPMGVASLAIAAGTVSATLAWLAPRRMPWIAAGLAAALVVTAPWLAATQVSPSRLAAHGVVLPWSYTHRLVIWEFTARLGLDRPLVGHGIDASDRLGRDEPYRARYRALVAEEGVPELAGQPPLHPHNAAIQIWYELGAIGVVLAALLLLALADLVVRLSRYRLQAAMATGFGAIAYCVGVLSFGLWQKWWIACVWLALAACAAVAPDLRDREAP